MPDGSFSVHDHLVRTAQLAWSWSSERALYVRCSVAWVAFTAPDRAGGEAPDLGDLATHTMLLGFDDRYYAGLLRLFRLLRMGD